jgi:hypothetical protein
MLGWLSEAITRASRSRRGRGFDGHLAVQSRVGVAVDFAHTAGCQEALNPIGTQAGVRTG